MSLKIFNILSLTVLLILPVYSRNNSFYISEEGSDRNPGTLKSPWESIQHAITIAGAGDTVFFRNGVYKVHEVWLRKDRGMGGEKGQYLTIKNYKDEKPLIGGSRRFIVEADYVRIEGLYFQLPYRLSGGGEGFQVVNNTFIGPQPQYGAIEFFANNGLIEGNRIEIRGDGDTKDHGIYLHAGKNNIIKNNHISGSSGYGIHIFDAVSSGGNGAASGYDNILIDGNTIENSQYRAGIIIAPDYGLSATNIIIQKNIIANNAINGIRLSNNVSKIKIFNNTIFNNGTIKAGEDDLSAISIRERKVSTVEIVNNIITVNNDEGYHIQNREDSEKITVKNNLYWGGEEPLLDNAKDSNPYFHDPKFLNPEKGDFHLLKGSPAIDSGINVGFPFKGNAPDLGAMESNY